MVTLCNALPPGTNMTKPKRIKEQTEIALKADQRLLKTLVRIGNGEIKYMRCFQTSSKKQLALDLVNEGIYVWTEPVWEAAIPFQSMRRARYEKGASRNDSLKANAPNLWRDQVADYWVFPTLGDLDAFVAWYKTL